jgi:hypothetical protein
VTVQQAYEARRQMLRDERVLGALTERERGGLGAAAEGALRALQRGLGEAEVVPGAEAAAIGARSGVPGELVQQCMANYVRFRHEAAAWAAWAEGLARGKVQPPPGLAPGGGGPVGSLPPELLGAMQGAQQLGGQQGGYNPLASLGGGLEQGLFGAGGGSDEAGGPRGGAGAGAGQVQGERMSPAQVRVLEERRAAESGAAGRRQQRPSWARKKKR